MVESVVDYDAWNKGYRPPSEHELIHALSYEGAKVKASSHLIAKSGWWIVVQGEETFDSEDMWEMIDFIAERQLKRVRSRKAVIVGLGEAIASFFGHCPSTAPSPELRSGKDRRSTMNGPKELAVRGTLEGRPAGLLERIELPPEKRSDAHGSVESTFAALFNGARQGSGHPDRGPNFGKAEAEWGWPNAWYALRDAGLITIAESIQDAPGMVGGKSIEVKWGVTELGWQVRDDDLAYFRELMDARRADEADAMAMSDAELEPFAREAAIAWCNKTRREPTDDNMAYFLGRWRTLEPFRVDVALIRARSSTPPSPSPELRSGKLKEGEAASLSPEKNGQ